MGLQGLNAQSTLEAERVAAALTMKEAVFGKNMMEELRFKNGFGSVPLYIGNSSALHVAGNRTYSPRTKHIALRYFLVQELVEDDTIIIVYVKTQDQLADIWTKHINKQRHRELINNIRGFWDLNDTEGLIIDVGVFAGTMFCCVRRPTSQEH